MQILIQSKKENLSNHISKIKNFNEQNKKVKEISENYISFVKQKNEENKSSSKNFFILIKYSESNFQEIDKNTAINILNERYFKVKETLSRCGNTVYDISSKSEVENILISFFNSKIKTTQEVVI